MSVSVPKTLSTFPYLSPKPSSSSTRLGFSKLGTGPKVYMQPHPPPHLTYCPLPLLSRRIRTRPLWTALSSEANTNQPQMFTLGKKGQQMQSHSIKLHLSLLFPLFPCLYSSLLPCLSDFLSFTGKSTKNPRDLFRSVGGTKNAFSSSLTVFFFFCDVSHTAFLRKSISTFFVKTF